MSAKCLACADRSITIEGPPLCGSCLDDRGVGHFSVGCPVVDSIEETHSGTIVGFDEDHIAIVKNAKGDLIYTPVALLIHKKGNPLKA